MIVPQEPELPKSKKGKLLFFGLPLLVGVVIVILLVPSIIDAVNPQDFWAPGSGTEVFGAPDGTYLQKDWGSFDNQTREWSFAMCDHDYLGPLHGSWPVKENVWVPTYQKGVYPIDAQLYVIIKDNIVVGVEIKSQLEYSGNSDGWYCPGGFDLVSILPMIIAGIFVVSLIIVIYILQKQSPVTTQESTHGEIK